MTTTTETHIPENRQQATGNRPIEKLRFGRIQANIWENTSENGSFFAVSFERRYQAPETGEWRSTQSFRADDLLLLAKAADKAHDPVLHLIRDSRT